MTVDAMMTAVSAGELVESALSMDGKQRTFYYDLSVPTSACNIGLAVGSVTVNHVLLQLIPSK